MKYLKFDKSKLTNLEYSTSREYIRTNRAGAYASTTLVGCNTRKYHGMLVCPVEKFGNEKYVFLSSLDESIVSEDGRIDFGIHKYGHELYHPTGHQYVVDFEAEYDVKTTYMVGSLVLTKEFIMVNRQPQVIVKYTVVETARLVTLQLKPFLANRNIHSLSHANMDADTRIRPIQNGVVSQMYKSLPAIYMQTSVPCDFVPVPDWYYGMEYSGEMERGYDYKEDLFVPGYFEVTLERGDSVYFSASLNEIDPQTLSTTYFDCLSKRLPRNNFYNCLRNSAQQFFVVRNDNQTEIVAGYPWFGAWGRDTFIALPGLTLAIDDTRHFENVVDTMVSRMKNGLFPNMGNDDAPAFNSVDAPLWFFTALQEYAHYIKNDEPVWNKYASVFKSIIESYAGGALPYNIHLDENGLIWQGEQGKALTWMDAVVDGIPVTPRTGFAVEINVLWYNALCWVLSMADKYGDREFVEKWSGIPERAAESFMNLFWSEEKGYLADCSDGTNKDYSIRPNQIFAVSSDYSPLDPARRKRVLDNVRRHLLTPRGLRTLAPEDINYHGTYNGNQAERDAAYHQGTVWPWLLGPYAKGCLKVQHKTGLEHIKQLYYGFEDEMTRNGVSSISEIYDGNPPYRGKGAVSQAWSVAALLTMHRMIEISNGRE